MSIGINRGIGDCCRNGILKSAALVANGAALDHAIDLAGSLPDLDVGVHLCLNDLAPLGTGPVPAELIDDNGMFFPSFSRVVNKLMIHPGLYHWIKGEFRRQIECLLSKGVHLSHLNSHKHIHIFPPLWHIVSNLAEEYKIPFVRYPLENVQRLYQLFLDQKKGRKKTAGEFVFLSAFFLFFSMHRQGERALAPFKKPFFRVPDSFYGLYHTGFLNKQTLADIAGNIRPGINELMCHPGYIDDELLQLPTRLTSSRKKEVALLCSPEIKNMFTENNIHITSFSECCQL